MTRTGKFRSWFIGGFESASMRLDTGRRVDVIAALAHDVRAREDYALLASAGIRTVRDALRWHLIEVAPGTYDWSSALQQIRAARETNTQIIWDLAHFGFPDWLDPWGVEFPKRFADYAEAAARLMVDEFGPGGVWSPINEISYWAFAGGDQGHFAPLGKGRGAEWKYQLVRAATAASARITEIDPVARFLQPEPTIHIGAENASSAPDAQRYSTAMFEAWDMISGVSEPQLGGKPEYLDYIGINFYPNNQWMLEGRRLGMGEIGYRPLSEIILEVWSRYRRPILISETGAEGQNLRGWLRYVVGEVEDAIEAGAVVAGLCVYPISDYPGWTDDRMCPCGLIEIAPQSGVRRLRRNEVDLLESEFGRWASLSR